MNARLILMEWLTASKYDGLCNVDCDCGCAIDDLVPCCQDPSSCRPAYMVMGPAPDGGDHDDFHMVPELDPGQSPDPHDRSLFEIRRRYNRSQFELESMLPDIAIDFRTAIELAEAAELREKWRTGEPPKSVDSALVDDGGDDNEVVLMLREERDDEPDRWYVDQWPTCEWGDDWRWLPVPKPTRAS